MLTSLRATYFLVQKNLSIFTVGLKHEKGSKFGSRSQQYAYLHTVYVEKYASLPGEGTPAHVNWGKIWQGDKKQRKVWIEKRRKGKIFVKRVAVARQRWQENPGSIVSLCIPRTRTADPLDRKQIVDPLDQWDCVVDWNCRASTGLPPSNLTKALTGHCVARRSRTCKERNGTGEGNVWSQLAFHIVGTKPSEASHCRHGA